MLTYLRYALATFCFAASVGCLALWCFDRIEGFGPGVLSTWPIEIEARSGVFVLGGMPDSTMGMFESWEEVAAFAEYDFFQDVIGREGLFGRIDRTVYFPLWYPALIFALAGIASLRLGRRFTLRSAIIATAVVAGLLGMVVGM
jgi:hypothetical protein